MRQIVKKFIKSVYSRLTYLLIGLSFSVVIIYVNAAIVSTPVPTGMLTPLTTERWNQVISDLDSLNSVVGIMQANVTTMQADITNISSGDSYINELGVTVTDTKTIPKLIELYNSDTSTYECQTFNVEDYCGDYDGCKIRLVLQHELDGNDQVRIIDENIYMEQTPLSPNNNSGIYGWTRQSGGGDDAWITGISNRYTIFHPWDWVWVFNYIHDYCPGQVGNSPAHVNPYSFTFMSHPHVRARFIIYD